MRAGTPIREAVIAILIVVFCGAAFGEGTPRAKRAGENQFNIQNTIKCFKTTQRLVKMFAELAEMKNPPEIGVQAIDSPRLLFIPNVEWVGPDRNVANYHLLLTPTRHYLIPPDKARAFSAKMSGETRYFSTSGTPPLLTVRKGAQEGSTEIQMQDDTDFYSARSIVEAKVGAAVQAILNDMANRGFKPSDEAKIKAFEKERDDALRADRECAAGSGLDNFINPMGEHYLVLHPVDGYERLQGPGAKSPNHRY